jgi:tryptophan-rich sensory protein
MLNIIFGSFSCLAVGMLSGYFSHSGNNIWYQELVKPSLNPPAWVFAPVWTILYIMIGAVAAILWSKKENNKMALAVFLAQLFFNLLWSPLFFYFQRIDLALIDVFMLWSNIAALVYLVKTNLVLVLLLTPYFLWVSFAAYLNLQIYLLN